MGKVIAWVLKQEIRDAAGPLQTCASHGAGAEAAIHAMRKIFEDNETDAVLLIDASNAFNSMNRMVALHNIQMQCPSMATYLINTYRHQSRLFISGGAEISSMEGTTQGDPLAMPWYSVNTCMLIKSLRYHLTAVKQVWLADDAAAGGKLEDLVKWYDMLCHEGNRYGYFVNGSKSWLIVKTEEDIVKAKNIFGNRVNITSEGKRHLGAVLGTKSYKDEYCNSKVSNWIYELKLLSTIASTKPQEAYIVYTKGFRSKLTYFQRTIPGFEEYLTPLQNIIEECFITAIFGEDTPLPAHLINLFSLPTSKGGLSIPVLKEDTEFQNTASLSITSTHTESIVSQSEIMLNCNSEGKTTNDLMFEFDGKKRSYIKEKEEKILKELSTDMKRLVKQYQSKGTNSWLGALPIEEQGFHLSKEEFRDALRLRYNLKLQNLPPLCACGDPFDVVHALSCKKGGFVSQRHDNIRDVLTCLLDAVCTNVRSEPHLTKLTGEQFEYRTANTSDEARLDIKARNFWRRGQDAFFDIRVTHVLNYTINYQLY